MTPRAALIGPPGAGKTAVGRALARVWGGELRDTDADVEALAGKTVSEIFIDDGEPHFRNLEATAVRDALESSAAVVSLGGGAPMGAIAAEALRAFAGAGGAVVFLDVSVGVAVTRTGLSAARPLLLGNPRQQWTALMEARRPRYEELATLTVLTDELTPEQVADVVMKELL